MAFSVMDHLSKWLQRQRIGDNKPPTFWPSSAGATDKSGVFHGTCRRQAFLQYVMPLVKYSLLTDKKYEFWKDIAEDVKSKIIPFNKYQLWLFDSADRYEEYITEHAKESGIYIADQTPMYIPTHNISGKIDLITYNFNEQKYIICEVKSVYSYGADEVLGKDFDRFRNFTGKPRTKNLMQVALYQWHFATDKFENARLQYGDRGTGKYAEYEVRVKKDSGLIEYRCIDPLETKWESPAYTIHDILEFYESLQRCIDEKILPQRDYELVYPMDYIRDIVNKDFKIIELDKDDNEVKEFDSVEEFVENNNDKKGRKFILKEINSTNLSYSTAEQFVKWKDRTTNGGRQVKKPDDGDFHCRNCSFRNFCYNEDKSPRKD